jgi:hypothetical protein
LGVIQQRRADLGAMEADIFECMVVEGHEFGLGAPKSSPSNECSDRPPHSV